MGSSKKISKANQLSAVLYQELLDVKKYHETFFALALEEEVKNTAFFLKNWNTLSLDTLKMFRQKELKYLSNASAITGIKGFQYFYDYEFPFYKTAINDGTISIIKNKEFINLLSLIYIRENERMDFFEQSISKLDQTTNNHILQNYAAIFADADDANGSPWSERAYDEFFRLIEKDNRLRFLLTKG